MVEYKADWYGATLIKAPRYYPSSKTCSVCGAVREKMDLSERQYECGICGFSIDRDENAARNLAYLSPYLRVWSESSFALKEKSLVTKTTGSSPGNYAC